MAAHAKPFPAHPSTSKAAQNKRRPSFARAAGQRIASKEPIAAAKAKTHFLQLLDEVEREREPITITKRGRVVAQLVPAPPEKKISNFDRVYGSMAGTGKITGDIVSPDWEAWGPEWR